jgi:diguanylate cyclase (GGDEF)-like protein
VGRFGPRSLAFRLLIVLLVPIVGLQVFAFREVQHQQRAADTAAHVSRQVELLQAAGTVVVPLYLELIATHAVTQAQASGTSRDELMTASKIDLLGWVLDQRPVVDETLAKLGATQGDVQLEDGSTISTQLAAGTAALRTMRAQYDTGDTTIDQVNAGFAPLTTLLASIRSSAGMTLADSASSNELAEIGGETEQVFSMLGYASTELQAITDTGLVDNAASVANTLEASGSLNASLAMLRRSLDAAQLGEFDKMVTGNEFKQVESSLRQYVASFTGPDATTAPPKVYSPMMTSLLASSLLRLQTLQQYSSTFFETQLQRANAVQQQADTTKRNAIIVIAVSVVVSLTLLALVMRSILRPLSRLVRTSNQLSSGDLAVATNVPSGPTDIRVVTQAFNEMVVTLRAYESQVRRLAHGDLRLDTNLPGPLGENLRQSVGHLAAVTSQLHASEAAAVVQARTDALTGLANRHSALEDLAVIAMQARTTDDHGAIIFLDLDGFKSVNDTQGHGEGDRILSVIGQRLRGACPDHLIARIGGDEFVVLVERAGTIDDVVALAGQLITEVSNPIEGTEGQLFTLSASAGVTLIDGSRDPLGVMAQADSAVYHAKEQGRGRVEVFDERLAEAIEERADMALSMRQGITTEQFVLKLQPIIEVATKQPIGAEVLLRWNRPGIGEVGPTEFIPIAERTNVIIDLESWVLEQVVEILRDWRLHPTTARMRLAVNISGRHIVDGNLASLLDTLCTRASVDPSLLDLEITETHLVADIGRARSVVDDLRDQGVRVAIDDFGTGYSSMTYLHQLTVDTLKIDRVFVAGMCDDRLDRTIVELLLRLGDSLGLNVIAEGVDSEAKLKLLDELHCPWAQGFYIAKPMGIPEATAWLRQQEALATSLASSPPRILMG